MKRWTLIAAVVATALVAPAGAQDMTADSLLLRGKAMLHEAYLYNQIDKMQQARAIFERAAARSWA